MTAKRARSRDVAAVTDRTQEEGRIVGRTRRHSLLVGTLNHFLICETTRQPNGEDGLRSHEGRHHQVARTVITVGDIREKKKVGKRFGI